MPLNKVLENSSPDIRTVLERDENRSLGRANFSKPMDIALENNFGVVYNDSSPEEYLIIGENAIFGFSKYGASAELLGDEEIEEYIDDLNAHEEDILDHISSEYPMSRSQTMLLYGSAVAATGLATAYAAKELL